MKVPDFQTLMQPILEALTDGQTRSSSEIRADVAAALGISPEAQAEMLPSGSQTRYTNRVAWALSHMGQARLVERVARGSYRLTDRGRQILQSHPERVDMSVLAEFPEYREFRARRSVRAETEEPSLVSDLPPSEVMAQVMDTANAEVAAEVLDRVLEMEPTFLELLALRLLKGMGYGGRDDSFRHTGQGGDAGLDGIVRQDALGLERVGVQAKRYDRSASVGRPEIQAFVGALHGARMSRGVFITTARFSSGAIEFAKSVPLSLILIDGKELSRLMVSYGVGVSVRETFQLMQLDEEFFEN